MVMEPSRWDLCLPVSFPTWLVSTQVCCDSERSEISKVLALSSWEMVQAKRDCGPTGRPVREHGNEKSIPGCRLRRSNTKTCSFKAWARRDDWEGRGVRGTRQRFRAEAGAPKLGDP